MAITLASNTPVHQGVQGSLRYKVFRVNGPASYTTGGTSFTAAEVFMSRLVFCEALSAFYDGTNLVQPHMPVLSTDGSQLLLFEWTSASVNTAHKQVTATTNLAAYEGLIRVWGT